VEIAPMEDARLAVRDLLRQEFTAEQAAGFPRLKRIPSTQVFRFLDYFAGLSAAEQGELADAIADRSSYFFGSLLPLPYRFNAAYDRFAAATEWRGFGGGLRYTPVKLLAGVAKDTHVGGLDGWFKMMGFTGLSLQPPEGLLSSPAALVPVKKAALRKAVNAALTKLFAPKVKEIGDGTWRYDGTLGTVPLRIMIHFSRSIADPDWKYEITTPGLAGGISGYHCCFESLFGAGYGWWDYVTEENFTRSVELFPALVTDVIHFVERVVKECGR
jgi:hypothetical protein